MRRRNSILLNMACLAAGLLLGLSMAGEGSSEQQPSSSSSGKDTTAVTSVQQRVASSPVATLDPKVLREDIRMVLREELQAAAKATQEPAAPKDGREPAQEVDQDEQRRVYEDSALLVRNAISAGRWSEDDRRAFRSTIHRMSIEQQNQVIGELFGAIQAGRIKLQDDNPPL